MPAPEVIIWQAIRRKQLKIKFRRQYTIENRILDFYSPQIKLGIEIDGDSHFISSKLRKKELESDKKLAKKYGIKILRFYNSEVMKNLEGVLEIIFKEIEKRRNKKEPPPPTPPPPTCVGGGGN